MIFPSPFPSEFLQHIQAHPDNFPLAKSRADYDTWQFCEAFPKGGHQGKKVTSPKCSYVCCRPFHRAAEQAALLVVFSKAHVAENWLPVCVMWAVIRV